MRRALLACALLGLSLPAQAKKPEPPPTSSRSAAAAPSPKAASRDAAFAAYKAEMDAGQLPRAADALVALTDDPAQAPFHAEAHALLGDLLAKRDLPYAALLAYARAYALATDTDAEVVGGTVADALALADKVGDPAALQAALSKNLGLARNEDVKGRVAYLAARESFRTKSYAVALAVLKTVPPADPRYAEAKLLEGVILNQQGRAEQALVPLEAASKAGEGRKGEFADLLALNLARSYFAAGNFPRAIQFYGEVSRASEWWPEAQFERAWSHFRMDDMNGTLSTLMTLEQPFFKDWYWPEADLLRIYGAFLMCKFPEANTDLEAFKTTYAPIRESLKGFNARGARATFDAARAFVEKDETAGLPRMLLRPYASEARFLGSLAAVRSAEGELARLGKAAANPFTDRARQWIEERRDALVTAEGERIGGRLDAQQADLATRLADAEIFGLDILRMQQQQYEAAANTGKIAPAARKAKRADRKRKAFREWPYQGEAWADELGYYRVDSTPECPANMRKD